MGSKYRALGLGKELFETAIKAAKENNYKKIYTGTMKIKVKAQKFYQNQRFKPIQKELLPPIFQAQALDEMFYVLNLDASLLNGTTAPGP